MLRGHAIECRVNAEDPTTFLPSPGRVARYREPAGPGIRVDSALEQGGEIVALYDPMVAKLVVWDRTRDLARARMRARAGRDGGGGRPHADPAPPADHGGARVRARRDVRRPGRGRVARPAGGRRRAAGARRRRDPQPQLRRPRSTAGASRCACTRPTTRCWSRPGCAGRRAAPAAAVRRHAGTVTSPMQGSVLQVEVAEGDTVAAGQVIAIIEAMKMENEITAPRAGRGRGARGGGRADRHGRPGDLPDQRRVKRRRAARSG